MISFDNVSKSFRIYRKPSDWLKERVLRRPFHEIKRALTDVSFSVGSGEVFGIIGQNGAGKSTLLKLVMGVLLPDSGKVHHDGRVTGLLELGSGFNRQVSGAENITFNGTLLGMTADEIDAKREAIVAYSELGDAILNPLRTYSSGMTMRLAFSIAMHADPACLVVDEALAVGDAHFQQKCVRSLKEFKARGGSILFVSHDLNALAVLCDRAMVLEKGEVVCQGDPQAAIHEYKRIVARADSHEGALALPVAEKLASATSYGVGQAEILSGTLVGAESGGATVSSGESVRITVTAQARRPLNDVAVGILIRDRLGQDVFGTNTAVLGEAVAFDAGDRRNFVFTMPMSIMPGHYTVTVALTAGLSEAGECYHWCDNLIRFEVVGFGGHEFAGLCDLKPAFSMEVPEHAE